MLKLSLPLCAISLFGLLYLASCDQPGARSQQLKELLNPQTELWKLSALHSPQHFRAALDELNRQLVASPADLAQVDRLLYFLRAYSYFGPLQPLDNLQLLALDSAMQKLSAHPQFSARTEMAARLQEHFAVTLYRFYDRAPLENQLAQHLPALTAILQRYQSGELSRAEKYSLWESFRALGFLAYQAKHQAPIKRALTEYSNISSALLDYSRSDNATKLSGNTITQPAESDWPLRHGLWALGNIQLLLEEEAAAELDEKVWALLSQDLDKLDDNTRRELYTRPYLVSSYRGKSACEENFAERCWFPNDQEALPITHACSGSLVIRANHMNQQELTSACKQLLAQEETFHHKLASGRKPVANDHNIALEVVVFDNYSQYNQYGQLLFDISTDNGGMFLEGEPEKPGNQARFIAFEAFWKQPQFSIWNLEHEYVHYLDGRFNKQGTFGHFPSHLVWWSEGLANYIANGEQYQSAERDLHNSRPSERPTLQDIFATTYEDGSARVYSWSYLAMRFLYQTDQTSLAGLAENLRRDDFDGYRKKLDTLARELQPQFAQWLTEQAQLVNANSESDTEKLPRQLYRYLYRDYLQPQQLAQGELHRHRG